MLKKTFSNSGGLNLLVSVMQGSEPLGNDPSDPQPNSQQHWCICGKCRSMPLEIENVCCKKHRCVTTMDFFESAVLDMTVLSISIVNRSDVFAEDPEYSPSSYRKAAYRQWILWNHGYLGRANRRVVPSCVVWAVRDRYPAPPGTSYLGFKEY